MPKSIWLLVIATAINTTGASFIWPLNVIYIHHELERSLAFAGLILLLNQAAAILGNLVGGTLFDRIGGYKTILLGGIFSGGSAILLMLYHSLTPYSILLILLGFGSGIIVPAVYAMAASVWSEGGRRAFNAIYVAQNVGVALGASLGGLVAAYSFSYIFIANAMVFVFFYLLVLFTFKHIKVKEEVATYSRVLDQRVEIKNTRSFIGLIILSAGFFICWIAYVQWPTTIASHTQNLGIPIDQYSLLWTINGALIIAGQPLIKLITRYVTAPKVQIYIGNAIFVASFTYIIFAESFVQFAIGMTILTLGEMLVWPAVPTLADGLAPKGKTGYYQGIINSVGAGGRMIGPLFGGLIVDAFPVQYLFVTLVILLFIPFVSTFIYDRVAKGGAGRQLKKSLSME